MRHLMIYLLLIFSPLALANQAERLKEANFPAQLSDHSPALERKSQAVLTYLWVDVYAAALFAEPSTSAQQAVSAQKTQRLELYYFRDIDRQDVIKAASATLERQQSKATLARLQPQLDQLNQSIQSIRHGDRYALTWQPGQGLKMECNNTVIFSSQDHELAQVYFSIWLGAQGVSDDLREALLTQN